MEDKKENIENGAVIRRTLRLSAGTSRQIDKMAETNNRSANNQIEYLLKLALGYRGIYPTIVVSEKKQAYFVLPIGTFGELNENALKRFIVGSIPFGKERWDAAFDTLEEALDSFGHIVCEFTDSGLRIADINEFLRLCKEMKIV